MDPDAASVGFLYQDPHPAHRGFAEAIGAEFIDYRGRSVGRLDGSVAADLWNGLRYPRHDIVLVEGSRPLYAALAHRLTSRTRLVYLCADHGLYAAGRGDFSGDSLLKSALGRFGTPAMRAAGRWGIDGVVAVSSFAADYTRPVVGDAPIEVAHPYIQSDAFDRFGEVDPSLDAPVAVTVGRDAPYKGVDRLVDAWPVVRSAHPAAELHVVGRGHPDAYGETEGVHVRGFMDDLGAALAEAAVYVQPSRMDAFPVSVLEAMRAGLPPIVTDTTGTRSEAREIDDELVVESTVRGIAAGAIAYFDRPLEERRRLSKMARKRGAEFDPDSRKAAFRDAFRRVVRSL